MKIGFNARYLREGKSGIENYAFNLIKNLLQIDKINDYFLFSPKQDNYLSLRELKGRFKEIIWGSLSLKPNSFLDQILKVAWEKIYLPYDLIRNKIDLFHDPVYSVPLYGNQKNVITVHDLTYEKYPEVFTWETRLYFRLFVQNRIKHADAIIAISESTKNDLVKLYNIPSDRINVICEGVDELFFEPTDNERSEKVLRQYLKHKTPYILNVAAMVPRKNIPRLLKAFALLAEKYKDLRLVLVGRKGWLCEEFEKMLADLKLCDRVILTGYVDDNALKILYENAMAFVFPSLDEGFGLPLLEAMACGTPIITSNVSSMPEIVSDAGLLVNPFDCEEIAGAIDQILSNERLRRDLTLRGKERVKQFNWKKTAKQTLAVYHSLA